MKKALIILCLTAMTLAATAQRTNTLPLILDSRVHSLQVAPVNNQYLPPVYVLGSDDPLLVSFDVLDYDVQYLRYSVTHCYANWQPSVLVESEYVDGFNMADIDDYRQSEATFVHYYNYRFAIPNEDLQLTKSGNYLLTVYQQDDPEAILFTTRFMVSENSVGIAAQVTSRTDVEYNGRFQQVSFNIISRWGTIKDPYNELTAIITQNSRLDNQAIVTKPLMVSGEKITFEHNPALVFAAGNEYRRFETVNVNIPNMGVASIGYFDPYYHATLYTDEPRAETQYLYDQTQHGHFTIRNSESFNDSDIDADYLITHFTLETGEQLTGGKLYLQGQFTEGLPPEKILMHYDFTSGCYYCDILLKQGHYNYQYLWVPDGTAVGQTFMIEGDKYQTANEYLITVYDRPMGERYDHLIGHALIRAGR